ncbi:hypothetical protein SAMN04487976_107192 [Xaviernesmea oryzae]|nr:hypothetical protein SAMN04487976_107192 [Xaviernesmea oryzae]
MIPLPSRWDFVWCAFPFIEKPSSPGDFRPCIVRQASHREILMTKENIPWVQVLYCTKQIDRLDRYSFIIDDPVQMGECGLYLETLVVTGRTTGLPWMPSSSDAVLGIIKDRSSADCRRRYGRRFFPCAPTSSAGVSGVRPIGARLSQRQVGVRRNSTVHLATHGAGMIAASEGRVGEVVVLGVVLGHQRGVERVGAVRRDLVIERGSRQFHRGADH